MMRMMRAPLILVVLASCGPGRDETTGLERIEVLPANATIMVENASSTAIAYTAIGHYSDGHTAELESAVFSLDTAAQLLGSLSEVAEFTANGAQAGTGSVNATAGSVSGATGVSVVVHRATIDPTAPGDAPGKFPDSPPMGPLSPAIAYPLENAVMPSTVKAPDVQWEGPGVMGDLFRIRMVGGLATVDRYLGVDAGFTFSSLPKDPDWRLVVSSAGGLPITVRVDHWDATTGAQASRPITFKAVLADVGGAIYYWDLSEGKIQRIDAMGRALAIPNPPAKPANGSRCLACHVVSRDGRYLAGELWGGSEPGVVFDMSNPAVRTSDPAPTMFAPGSYNALFATFNPDASRLLINPGESLALIDPKTGTSVAAGGVGLPAGPASHPTWSPDGTSIVYISDLVHDGAAWAVDYIRGNVSILPVTGPDAFGAPVQLVGNAAGDPAFAAPSWPSFTPDSAWIAYGAGINSRGRNAAMVYPGSLFLVSRAGGAPTRLDIACGGARNCYLPNFSPYDSGGYLWLAFYSLRDYGNTPAGTKGTGRRQMWVTAIDKSKLGTGDASMVPYWIPDQDSKTDNMSAFWAVPPPLL